MRALNARVATRVATVALVLFAVAGCKKKVSKSQCDTLVDRYASLVLSERYPDAAAGTVSREQERERKEARGDESFARCPTEVTEELYACAMSATTAAAIVRCLE